MGSLVDNPIFALQQENNLLNKDIDRLLHLLSPWAFEGKAHLVLEYLVRRYRVHEFNTDSLLKSLLVSHDSKVILLFLRFTL